MKKVVLCGKGSLALKILKWFHLNKDKYNITFIPVIPNEDETLNEWNNNEINQYCKNKKINVIKSGNLNDLPNIKKKNEFEYDILLSVFYKKIILPSQLTRFALALNIHLSELPKYRGSRGINWALKNKEDFQGVTIHLIDKYLDHGEIINQCKFMIYPYFEEVIDVYNRSLEYAYALFVQTMPNLMKIKPRKQNHKKATYYSLKDIEKLGERKTFTKKKSLKKK